MAAPPGIRINLLEVDKKQLERQKFTYIAIIIIIAMLGSTAGIYYSAFNGYKQQIITNHQLKSQLAGYQDINTALDVMGTFKNQVDNKRRSVSAVEGQKIFVTAIMEEIGRAVPAQVKLISTEIGRDKVIINGYSPDHKNVAALLSGLRESSFFNEVRMVSSEMDKESGEVKFVIENDWGVEQK